MSGHASPVASAGHTSRAKDPALVQEAQKPILWIRSTFLLVIGVIFFVWAYNSYQEAQKKAEEQKKVEAQQAATHEAQAPVVIGLQLIPYKFGKDGCVEVNLPSKWSDYPQGGKIKFISIETGQIVLEDEPGKKSSSALSPGWYRVCAAEHSATGFDLLLK